MKTIIIGLVGYLVAVSGSLGQTVPQYFNFQGRIQGAEGLDPDSEVAMEIRLWDALVDGEVVWGPQVFDGGVELGHGAKVPLVNGHFNLIIGRQDVEGRNLGDAFGQGDVFLGVTVEGNVFGGPQRVLSTPYSIRASFAETAGSAANAVTALAAEGLKGSDGQAYGWDVLFEGGTPAGGTLRSDLLGGRFGWESGDGGDCGGDLSGAVGVGELAEV